MYKSIFTAYLLLHIIGDFILQSDKKSKKKHESYVHVLQHGLLYSIPFFAATIFMEYPDEWLIQAALLGGAHLVVDTVKYFTLKGKHVSSPLPYIADQIVHVALLAVMTFFTIETWSGVYAADWVHEALSIVELGRIDTLAWSCMLLAIWKPANITIRKVLSTYKPQEEGDSKRNAGAMIGTLERIIMILLLGMAQYTAIALVLTAKSVARYDMLRNRAFAEYYLLGTLLSTLFVLAVFVVLAP
ncbi:MAG: DUF3307 domain-containing protein [Spirochaetota bacterium]